MHLNNILNQFQVTDEERVLIKNHFKDNVISHSAAVDYIEKLRN